MLQLQERIMSIGATGTGKTYGWLTIAHENPQAKFYVIDPDDGVRRVWYSEFKDVKNVDYYLTPRWFTDGPKNVPKILPLRDDDNPACHLAGVADAWKHIRPKLKQGDWVIVEHLGLIWASVQDGYVDEVFQKDIGAYFLEARKQLRDNAKRLDALKGWVDWAPINKMHNDDFIVNVCFDSPAHVYCTSSISPKPEGAKEDPEVSTFYGESTIRIDGQKQNPFRMHTILKFEIAGSGDNRKYFLSTYLKDRGRKWLDRQEITDNGFFFTYMVGVAGW